MTISWPDTHLDLADDDAVLLGRRITPQRARLELIGYERAATQITDVTLTIPVLLQTEDYARAVLGEGPDTDRRVRMRMERAEVLTRDEFAVELHAIVHMEALTRPVAPAAVMRGQLLHLRRMNKLPNVTIQVVPADEPGPMPSFAGPFTVFEFSHASPIVHTEHYRASVFLWEHDDVRGFMAAADEMAKRAMSPVQSAGVLADIASQGGGTPVLPRSRVAALPA